VDGTHSRTVAAGGSATITGLPAGQHTLQIEGVADNCQITNGVTQIVTVTAGQTAASTFQMSCDAVVAGLWEYSSDLTFDGLPCTLTELLSISQTGSNFSGQARSGWISCPLAGISEIAPGAAIVNGVSEQYAVAFDFDDSRIHHTGTYAPNAMSGSVRWQVDGVTVNGIWTAARTSGGALVADPVASIEDAEASRLLAERAGWLLEIARRGKR
jgi:hypothetical protein